MSLDSHPLRYGAAASMIEACLFERALQRRLEGHTLETSLELAELFETMRRFAWAFPPESDKEDEHRKSAGKKPRDWMPTRLAAIAQVRREMASTKAPSPDMPK